MFCNMLTLRHAAALALAAAAGAAQADASHTFVVDTALPQGISSVITLGTADVLLGARAYAFFSDGSSSQADFVQIGSGAELGAVAEASGAFVLAASSNASVDTGRPQEWQVTNLHPTRTLVGFAIDGRNSGSGKAAFDINFGASLLEEGTPGSSQGGSLLMDFNLRSFITGTVTVTYSQPLALNGAGAVGDLFGRVDVALAYSNVGLNGGLPANLGVFSQQRFSTDIDLVTYVPTSPVPEPGTAVLWLAGAAMLLVRQRWSRGFSRTALQTGTASSRRHGAAGRPHAWPARR